MLSKFKNIMNNLGPGLLYAGAAIGVSHLVGSTKAGAKYAFFLLIFIPLIHIIKYPFYKYGPQYIAITGKNILHGYKALGKWALGVYIGMTLLSMCLIQAAVTIVTSSIAVKFFKLNIPPEYMPHVPAIVFLLIAAALLYSGKYSMLDKMMKFIIIILTLTTIIAISMVLFNVPDTFTNAPAPVFDFGKQTDILFLAIFLGWMPAPMDITVWHSVWSEEANRSSGTNASVKKSILDFKIGYIGTAILAMCFLSLGAFVMYGSSEKPSPSGAVFAGQLIKMYTDTLGSWAYPLIGVAALATMFSTTLTCLDAYPRTLRESLQIWKGDEESAERRESGQKIYRLILLLAVAGTIVIFMLSTGSEGLMGKLVMFATVVAFISAPVIALINHMVMNGSTIPPEEKPGPLMKNWGRGGIIVLTACSLIFIWVKFIYTPPVLPGDKVVDVKEVRVEVAPIDK
ncbi:MAG: divalent metal cation transporter [Lentisphaerales bacterium]|nr:divalent metal cation transporter [Lentisphaerales bacterium]